MLTAQHRRMKNKNFMVFCTRHMFPYEFAVNSNKYFRIKKD